jgi:hypothetical protein
MIMPCAGRSVSWGFARDRTCDCPIGYELNRGKLAGQVLQRPGSVAVILAALTLLVGSGVAQAQSKRGPDTVPAAGPPHADPSPAAVKRTQTVGTPTTSQQPTPSPVPATSQPVAPVTPPPTRVPAPPATPTVQATQPKVHHKAKAALAKPTARPHKPPVKKAQPKIVTKKPVVKASGPAVKVPVAPATPANSPSQSVAANGGFWWSLTLPMVLLLAVLMTAAILLLVLGGRALLTRAMAAKRARHFAPWLPPRAPAASALNTQAVASQARLDRVAGDRAES